MRKNSINLQQQGGGGMEVIICLRQDCRCAFISSLLLFHLYYVIYSDVYEKMILFVCRVFLLLRKIIVWKIEISIEECFISDLANFGLKKCKLCFDICPYKEDVISESEV